MCTITPMDYFGLQRYKVSFKSPNYINNKKAISAEI